MILHYCFLCDHQLSFECSESMSAVLILPINSMIVFLNSHNSKLDLGSDIYEEMMFA